MRVGREGRVMAGQGVKRERKGKERQGSTFMGHRGKGRGGEGDGRREVRRRRNWVNILSETGMEGEEGIIRALECSLS